MKNIVTTLWDFRRIQYFRIGWIE